MFIGDKNYIEYTVEFKIKGDNSVNDIKNAMDFQSGLSPKSRWIGIIVIHFIM